MSGSLESLTLDFLTWLGPAPRPYAEVMEAWRTSCPRLTIWEDAVDGGLVAYHHNPGHPAMVGVTVKGARLLAAHRDYRSAGRSCAAE